MKKIATIICIVISFCSIGQASKPTMKSEKVENKQTKKPTSEIPEAFFINTDGNNFKLNVENEISAVAHGWYDTYLESSDAEIIQNVKNPLHYKVKPYKVGVCVINLYGVREDGLKMQIGVYRINVVNK